MKVKKTHYIDNKKFYTEMVKFHKLCEEAKDVKGPRPYVPSYIGECILKIATELATRPNFNGYSYKDEMISDGIENCLCYIHNFNPEKSNNPFAYFTQIIYYAFLRRIQKEKKQVYIKHKSLENAILFNNINETNEEINIAGPSMINVSDKLNDLVDNFESKIKTNKVKRKGVERFINEDI